MFVFIASGNPIKILTANVENELLPTQTLEQMLGNLNALLPQISVRITFNGGLVPEFSIGVNRSMHHLLQGLEDIMPKETLLWKLKLLKSAADFANSRLHAVRAEVLVLARYLII